MPRRIIPIVLLAVVLLVALFCGATVVAEAGDVIGADTFAGMTGKGALFVYSKIFCSDTLRFTFHRCSIMQTSVEFAWNSMSNCPVFLPVEATVDREQSINGMIYTIICSVSAKAARYPQTIIDDQSFSPMQDEKDIHDLPYAGLVRESGFSLFKMKSDHFSMNIKPHLSNTGKDHYELCCFLLVHYRF